ncbi:hypothetical protein LUZ60_001439 [Juncus effusus]|nr:hypothetical protein LUZ60_001439 [Juncus effusus]
MSSIFTLRTHISFPFSLPPRRVFSKPSLLRFIATQAQTITSDSHKVHHGPSLLNGRQPPPNSSTPNPYSIDRDAFTRVFDVASLRVPAGECWELERRLRGHLLNWPRIRNIARVPGDDVDPDMYKLLLRNEKPYNQEEREEQESLLTSQVLYREKLIKQFNHRGFVKFRNLAKISRPKTKNKTAKQENQENSRTKKESVYTVEVSGTGEDEETDWRGLIGEDFRERKWRGATRLLLLDERYAKKEFEDLPQAIKAVLNCEKGKGNNSLYELVQCQLMIFYNYWQMGEVLEALLPEGIIVPTGFETVGHIAHLNLRDEHLPYKKLIAEVILDKNKPKIKTVVNKIDAIQNDYRTMQLELLAGNHSLVTTVIESGIKFQVNLATVYWNSRLATERQRLINTFTNSDIVCDVFAGVGPISICSARKVKRVYANDLNPTAVEYLERNIVLNKLDRKIKVFNMDGRRFINAILSSYNVTQVVMNLPNDATEFLDAFIGIFRNKSDIDNLILPKIHIYGFSKSQDPEFDFHERINMALCEMVQEIEIHRVRLVAPGKWMLCASFILPKNVTFAKPPFKIV